MINQPLKEVIESLSDTLDATHLRVSDEQIFIQACTFLRTPKVVGEFPNETKEYKIPDKTVSFGTGKQKTMAKPASQAQIDYFHKHGLGNTENLTASEAFKKIKEHKEKNEI